MENNQTSKANAEKLIHDLRSSLTNIKLTTELILAKKLGDITDLQQELLEQAKEDCINIETIMQNFLDTN